MKVLGIELSAQEVIVAAMQHNGGVFTDLTGKVKPFQFENGEDGENVRMFKNTLHALFDNISPDFIVVNWRNANASGKYAPSPISFKIEGLIQLYEKCPVILLNPATLRAYIKKNKLPIAPRNKHQTNAMEMAFYQISKP